MIPFSIVTRFGLPSSAPNKQVAWLLWLVTVLNISTLITQLTSVAVLLIVFALGMKAASIYYQQMISRWLVLIIAVLTCVTLIVVSRQLGVLLTMLHLLCCSYALKQFEIVNSKDFSLSMLLGLFVLASALIFNQSLVFSSVIALLLVINFVVLANYINNNQTLFSSFKNILILILKSAPLAVILFVLLPKLAPFWKMPLANSAKTGLSATVEPGDIANLVRSNALAFRVKFTGKPPKFTDLYWRALVLEQYNGERWQRSTEQQYQAQQMLRHRQSFKPQVSGRVYQYQLISEASYQPWLYVIAVANLAVEQDNFPLVLLPDYTWRATQPMTQTSSYMANSYPDSKMSTALSAHARRINLALPAGFNPRLLRLGQHLRAQYSSAQALSQAVLSMIHQQAFRYTLHPDPLIKHSLDQFFFETKSGFCVHYASAFAVLMRAAGIPARVVTGYMGGEYNNQGDYFSIYQYDAHAWTEIWIDKVGWQRVDPTAAVSPERVEHGFSNALFAQPGETGQGMFRFLQQAQFNWLKSIPQTFAALDFQWTRWVVGYSVDRQVQLLNRLLGSVSLWKIAILIGAFLIISLAWLYWIGRAKPFVVQPTSWVASYQRVMRCLATQGIVKPKAMGADVFALQIAQQYPSVASLFEMYTQLYCQINYYRLSVSEQAENVSKLYALERQLCRLIKDNKLYTKEPN